MLDSKIKKDLEARLSRLAEQGKIYNQVQLNQYYSLFRLNFGIEKLLQLNGQELLYKIHNISDPTSMDYWLEYKDDVEFPAHFGSIAGGSALKYGIYLNKKKNSWFRGSSQNQIELTLEEAIEYVTKQREQLVKGYEEIDRLSLSATLQDYKDLQLKLNKVMPDLVNLAFVHKYFSLLFPEKIDDYHNSDYHKYHLLKILVLPDADNGKYNNAYYYKKIAEELSTSMNSLTTVLNNRDGKPQNYWRIGTTTGDGEDRWNMMKENKVVAIGWDKINQDLSFLEDNKDSKEKLRQIMSTAHPDQTPQMIGKYTQQVFDFVHGIKKNDTIIAMHGKRVRGIGKVSDIYFYEEKVQDFRHRRLVDWINSDEWELDDPEGLRTTVHCFGKKPLNIIEIEKQIQLDREPEKINDNYNQENNLNPTIERIKSVLERKGQVLLYGPPGTGKTYWARKAANELAALKNYNKVFNDLSDEDQNELRRLNVSFCSFHPVYGYEDFIEAYRPIKNQSNIIFDIRPGIFKELCRHASDQPAKSFYLIIDEINRGDIPRIFGELITLLESDKRDLPIILPLSGTEFKIPKNIYLIGTMNTADRSIALLDTALRRRFGFIELMPDYSILENTFVDNISLSAWLKVLNKRIRQNIGQNGRNLQIGHSYLLLKGKPVSEPDDFIKIIREDIIPLLEEYTYEDYDLLQKILGPNIVDTEAQEIHNELFENENWDEIKQSLLFDDPDMLLESKDADVSIVEADEENTDSEDK